MSAAEEKPAWLVTLDQAAHEEDADDVGRETVVFVRDLLLAPESDEEAISRTIEGLRAYYQEHYCQPDDLSWKQDPTFGTGQVVGSVVAHVFSVAPDIPYDDFRHRRLADLVIELKKQAAPIEMGHEVCDLHLLRAVCRRMLTLTAGPPSARLGPDHVERTSRRPLAC
jgi:hypothetical protein